MLKDDFFRFGERPDSPVGVAMALPQPEIHQDITRATNGLETTALENIRSRIEADFERERTIKACKSKIEYAENVFPDEENPDVRRNLINKLLNQPYGSGCGYTRDLILRVAMNRGIPVDGFLRQASSMGAKRQATALAVLPRFELEWANRFSNCPPLPLAPDGSLGASYSAAIGRVGMPAPERFLTQASFGQEVEAVAGWAPELSAPERFWVATWSMVRPFFRGFDSRVRQAARVAIDQGHQDGNVLLHYLDTFEFVLTRVRRAADKVGWPNTRPEKVLAEAERTISRRSSTPLTLPGLEVFLHEHKATVQSIWERRVGVGWFLWHDDGGRRLAHRLLTL